MKGNKTMQELSNNLKQNKEVNYTSINKPKIELIYKTNYGNALFYPNCFISKKFVKLTKTKTLSFSNIKDIKSMGFEIIITNYNIGNITDLLTERN